MKLWLIKHVSSGKLCNVVFLLSPHIVGIDSFFFDGQTGAPMLVLLTHAKFSLFEK